MATQPTDTGRLIALPGIIPPMPAVVRILARYDRPKLAAFIAIAIDLLDTLDGNADSEDSDPGEGNGDEADCASTEWHGLSWRAQRSGRSVSIDPLGRNTPDEGDEEDDAAGQYDEDCYTGRRPRGHGPGCSISDPNYAIDDVPHDGDEIADPSYPIDQSRGPEPYAASTDRELMRRHRDRIRRTRCRKRQNVWGDHVFSFLPF